MSAFDKHRSSDFSKFDTMSTEVLNEILRQDALLSENEESDMDLILYIMEVVAKREQEQSKYHFSDVSTAWNSFCDDYRNFADETSLYDLNDPMEQSSISDSNTILLSEAVHAVPQKKRGSLRVAVVAAAVIAVLFTSSVVAYAFGFDLWGAVATWTKDTFGFENAGMKETDAALSEKTAEVLLPLRDEMEQCGLPTHLLPAYFPTGYELTELKSDTDTECVSIYCRLENGTSSIILQFSEYTVSDLTSRFEKDDVTPEIYEHNGITYYIMTNFGRYQAVWLSESVEGVISGLATYEELIETINSI